MAYEELFRPPILDPTAIADDADLLLQHQLDYLDCFLSLEEEEHDDDKPQVWAMSTVTNGSPSSSSRATGSPPPAVNDEHFKRRKMTDGSKRSSRRKKPKLEKETPEPAPAGFIHVRARRGEATDSHSLAERVRREKISERMRTLQGLIPGCDKVKGKQHVLDEIINYVQSLQNQIEFLSAKITCLSGAPHAVGINSEDSTNQMLTPEEITTMMASSSVLGGRTTSPNLLADDYYQMMEPFLLNHQGPAMACSHQVNDASSLLMQVLGKQEQGMLNI